MKHRLSPLFSILISLITLLTTGFVTATNVNPVVPVEKKVAVVFIKFSPDCSSEAACLPDFPADFRATILAPRYTASSYAYQFNLTMTSFITQATYNHTHMTFTAMENPNSSDGWFDAPHPLENYNDPQHNPDFVDIFNDGLQLAYSVAGAELYNYDALLIVNNFQSLYGYTVGCGYTAPGDYVTCNKAVPTPMGPMNKEISLVRIGEHENLDRMMAVLGHELGHVHNLFHVRMGPYDIVGNSPVLVHYGGWSKSRAGWVPEVTDLEGIDEITVALDPLEYPGHNVLRIPYMEYGDNFAGYIVECRAKTGFDALIPEEGVIVSYASTSYVEGLQGYLEGRQAVIQFPEHDEDYNDAALQPGETYASDTVNLTITYVQKDSSNRCVVKAVRGPVNTPDPMIRPYTEQESGAGYIEYTSRDIWIDSQANGWDVYESGEGLTSDGGQSHPVGYGDPFWVNHENRIKYLISNIGYGDATNLVVNIFVTQPIMLYDECDQVSSPNTQTLLATQTIPLLQKDGYYFGEVPWTPTSSAAAQVKVVIADYMGEVTHANNTASETYASQNIVVGSADDLHASTDLLGAFADSQGISLKYSMRCHHPYRYTFTRKVISAIDRRYWVIDDWLSQGSMAPGEEQVVPFSGTPPKDAVPGECEEVLIELRVMRDDFYIPVDGFTYKSCAVAPSTLTCNAPAQPIALGQYVSTGLSLSPAKGGEVLAIDYISPSGKHQIVNRNVMSNGGYTNRFKPDELGKWQMQVYWQGSDSTAPTESGICTFEIFSDAPGFTLTAGSNCRSGPGTDYDVLTAAPAGTVMPIDARSEDGQWLYGRLNGQVCWIYSGLGTYRGSLFDLPVKKPPEVAPEAPLNPVINPTLVFRPPILPLDVCRTYKTQAVCNRYKANCKWVTLPAGTGVCIKR